MRDFIAVSSLFVVVGPVLLSTLIHLNLIVDDWTKPGFFSAKLSKKSPGFLVRATNHDHDFLG